MICVDEMGPLSARTHAGQELVRPRAAPGRPAERARQEVDYGRRATEGYVFGGFRPATGEALTACGVRKPGWTGARRWRVGRLGWCCSP